MSFPRPSDQPAVDAGAERSRPRPLRDPLVRRPRLPPGLRARGHRRGAGAARARVARDQAALLAGDPAAGRRRLRGDRPRPARLRRVRGRPRRLPRHRGQHPRPRARSSTTSATSGSVLGGRRLRRGGHPGPRRSRFPDLIERMVDVQLAAALRRRGRWTASRTTATERATTTSSARRTDADGLAAELATPEQRRRYIATFYSSRFWAHPGAFDDRRPSPSTPSPSATRRSARPGAATRPTFDEAARTASADDPPEPRRAGR